MPNSVIDVISEKAEALEAVEPLERTAEWEVGEVEEAFPSGL